MDSRPQTIDEWNAYLRDLLDVSHLVVLATGGGADLWVCPVYFAYDDDFLVFFISKPESRHMQNIAKDGHVACSIFQPTQDVREQVRGLQIAGKAHFVDTKEASHAFDTYFMPTRARAPVPPTGSPVDYTKPTAAWRLVEISPQRIECFDEKLFSNAKANIPPEVYRRA